MSAVDEVETTRRLLAGTNPVPVQALDGVAGRAHALALRRRITSTPRDPQYPLRPIFHGGRRTWHAPRRGALAVLASATAAVVIAVVVVIAPWSTPDIATAGTPPILDYAMVSGSSFAEAKGAPAGPVLTTLAHAAAARAPQAAAGDITYVKTDNWFFSAKIDGSSTSVGIRPDAMETWTSPDGSGVMLERAAPLLRLEGTLSLDGPTGTVTRTELQAGSMVPPTPKQVAKTDGPVALRALMLAATRCQARGSAEADCLTEAVVTMHQQQIVSPALDTEVWTILAGETGLVTLGDATDRAGRPAVAITTSLETAAPVRRVLLIDPTNGSLLGFELVAVDASAGYFVQVPAVVGFTAYLASGWTGSLPS